MSIKVFDEMPERERGDYLEDSFEEMEGECGFDEEKPEIIGR